MIGDPLHKFDGSTQSKLSFGGLGAAFDLGSSSLGNSGDFSLLAKAIQEHEGWSAGSLSQRNNNPGNLKFVGQEGASLGDKGFARFSDYNEGFAALQKQLSLDASRGLTLEQEMYKYAPPSENNTVAYLAALRASTGASNNTPLSQMRGLTINGGIHVEVTKPNANPRDYHEAVVAALKQQTQFDLAQSIPVFN